MKLQETIKKVLREYYERDKDNLYNREILIKKLLAKDKQGWFIVPKHIRDSIKDLPYITSIDNTGKKIITTKVPEYVYNYIKGKY